MSAAWPRAATRRAAGQKIAAVRHGTEGNGRRTGGCDELVVGLHRIGEAYLRRRRRRPIYLASGCLLCIRNMRVQLFGEFPARPLNASCKQHSRNLCRRFLPDGFAFYSCSMFLTNCEILNFFSGTGFTNDNNADRIQWIVDLLNRKRNAKAKSKVKVKIVNVRCQLPQRNLNSQLKSMCSAFSLVSSSVI